MVTDSASRPARPARSESREAIELQSIRAQHPELAGAVDMHLELLDLQRRHQTVLIVVTHSADLASKVPTRFDLVHGSLVRRADAGAAEGR